MHFSSAAIIVAGIAAQQAAATGWHVDAGKYSCPSNTDNQCSSQQQSGYDWSGLDDGEFSSYGDNSFSGWSCGNAHGKRDALTKRTFQSKCISGDLHKQPSIGCGNDKTMSIDEFHISVDSDVDLDCEFGMPDGSTCKSTHSCSSSGSVVKNDQCGGANSVTFKPRGGDSKEGSNSINVHSIGFNCGSASSSVPPMYSTSMPSSTPSSSASMTLSTVYSTHVTTSKSQNSDVTVTKTIAISTTYCPVTATESSSTESSSTPSAYSSSSSMVSSSPIIYSTGVSKGSSSAASSLPPYPTTTSPAPSSYQPDTPDVLPKCLNSWMWETGCKDNTDIDCYCKDESFINHVMQCLSAWAGSGSDTGSGASYLQGLCAAHVPNNPAIITACPSTTPVASSYVSSTGVMTSTSPSAYVSSSASSTPATYASSSSDVSSILSYPISSTASSPSSSGPASYATASASTPASYSPSGPSSYASSSASTPASYSPSGPSSYSASSSSPAGYTPGTTATGPVGTGMTSPAPTSSATVPSTIITYSSSITVPATYSTGVSQGYTMPGSSVTTQIVTTVTVPYVSFTTSTITQSGTTYTSTGLGSGPCNGYGCATGTAPAGTAPGSYGSSVPAPQPTGGYTAPPGGYPAPSGYTPTTFGTAASSGMPSSYAPSTYPSQSSPPFTGGAAQLSARSMASLALGAVAAFFVL